MIRAGKNEHLTRALHPIELIAISRLRHLCPLDEVIQFTAGFLREEVVSDPDTQLALLVQLIDNCVVVWKVLITAAASMALVMPSRFISRIKCRVELY